MKSKITGGDTKFLFETLVLNKYPVKYYKCIETGFIQTEEPYWLEEAYSSAITELDIGLPMRNFNNVEIISKIIDSRFDYNARFLDIAGGYGLFTRLMRDKGFNFFHHDVYCKNLFANHFDYNKTDNNLKFEAATLFEAFEHFNTPLEEIGSLFKYSDSILFSTELVPNNPIKKSTDWWYFTPETGQHIAFYTIKSLEHIAALNGVTFYTNGGTMHLFTKKEFKENPFIYHQIPDSLPIRLLKKLINFLEKDLIKKQEKIRPNHPSLMQQDFEYIKSLIYKNK